MPQTPVQDEPRKNPYITTGINKKFLTPCRQVGLSRKRKTPSSANTSLVGTSVNTPPSLVTTSLNSSLASPNIPSCRVGLSRKRKTPNSVNSSPFASSVNVLPNLDTTPLNSKLESNIVEKEKKKKKGKVSKCLMEEEDFVTDSGNCSKKKCTNTEPTVLNEVEESSISSLSGKEALKIKEKSSDLAKTEDKTELTSRIKQKKKLKNIGNNTEELNKTKPNKCGSEAISTTNIDESGDFETIASPKKLKKSKKVKNKKKIIIDSSDEEEVSLSNIKFQMIEEKIDDNQINSQHSVLSSVENNEFITVNIGAVTETKDANSNVDKHESTKTENNKLNEEIDRKENKVSEDTTPTLQNSAKSAHKSKKIKRCLSLKKSSGDFKIDGIDSTIVDCLVSLTPIESKFQDTKSWPHVSSTEVKDLEKQVKEKRKLVEELKQAEIYQKKHNIKELETMTSIWKQGCISALNDLLPGLQTHASIDMPTLLRNLNIPKEVITLSEDGQLI